MPHQPLKRDAQDDLPRPRRPAHPLFRDLQPFEQATAPQGRILKPRSKVIERRQNPGPRGDDARMKRFGPGCRQRRAPVLGNVGSGLGQDEILAQAFTGPDQVAVQVMTKNLLKEAGADYEESQEFINIPLQSKNIRFSIMARRMK